MIKLGGRHVTAPDVPRVKGMVVVVVEMVQFRMETVVECSKRLKKKALRLFLTSSWSFSINCDESITSCDL